MLGNFKLRKHIHKKNISKKKKINNIYMYT